MQSNIERTRADSIDAEWLQFLEDTVGDDNINTDVSNPVDVPYTPRNTQSDIINMESDVAPIPGNLTVSTKTKITYLSQPLDIQDIFWKLPVHAFHDKRTGIIKKVCKIKLNTVAEVEAIQEQINITPRAVSRVVSSKKLTNTLVDTKIKITVGISNKDIIKTSRKQTNAFLNCISLAYRFTHNDTLTETHVKMFNTGQIEIPGLKSDEMFDNITACILNTLREFLPDIGYLQTYVPRTVIINSNFNCGFFINRDKLNDLLKYTYNLQTSYVPWYPGINCKFYYNQSHTVHTGQSTQETASNKPISVMIFRTGSVLIVGKGDETMIRYIYEFIINILKTEYTSIRQINLMALEPELENKKLVDAKKIRKRRRKLIIIDTSCS